MFPILSANNCARKTSPSVFGGMFVFNQQHIELQPNIPTKIPFDSPQPSQNMRFASPDLTVLRGGTFFVSLNLHLIGGRVRDFDMAENMTDDAARLSLADDAAGLALGTFVRAQITVDNAPVPQLSVELNTRQPILQLLRQAQIANQRIFIPPQEVYSVSQSGLVCVRAGQQLAVTMLSDGINLLDVKAGSDLTALRVSASCS
ncbi:MAG: hypothetical protein FWD16_03570 [Clostridia bacterium]|nr:hypothetical protein [Clostridia bacterium]